MFDGCLFRRNGEDEKEFKFRIIKSKLEGDLTVSWDTLVEVFGLDCSADHLRKTAYGIYEAMKYYEEKALTDSTELSHEVLKKLEAKEQELYKERVKLADIRRETKNETRKLARMEILLEEMKKCFEQLKPLFDPSKVQEKEYKAGKTGVAMCSDWHIGGNVDNLINKYNLDIAKESVMQYAHDVIQYGKFHKIEKLVVANLGDLVNGMIHVSTRVNNEIDIIQQIMTASELLSDFVAMLSYQFKEIEVKNIIGNHGRTQSKKEEAIINENFENLIGWYMRERLRDFENVSIEDSKDGIVLMDIEGNKVALTHGDRDRLSNVMNLATALGINLNYVLMGHYHHKEVKDLGIRAEMIVARSMIGTDEYALGIRKSSKAGQTFLVFDWTGVIAEYNTIFVRKPPIQF